MATEPVEVRQRPCDRCERRHLLKDLRCDDEFSGLYCAACLPVPGTALPPGRGHLDGCPHDAVAWVWEAIPDVVSPPAGSGS